MDTTLLESVQNQLDENNIIEITETSTDGEYRLNIDTTINNAELTHLYIPAQYRTNGIATEIVETILYAINKYTDCSVLTVSIQLTDTYKNKPEKTQISTDPTVLLLQKYNIQNVVISPSGTSNEQWIITGEIHLH